MSRRNDGTNFVAGLSMIFSWADTSLYYVRWFNGYLNTSTYHFVPTIRTLAFAIEIKDIEEVLLKTNRVLIATLLAITLFSLFMVIILIKKKKTSQAHTPILKGDETPLHWAMDELKKLSKPTDGEAMETKKYYSALNNISRTFFHLQLQQNSVHQTTDEWMVNLQQLEMEGNTKISASARAPNLSLPVNIPTNIILSSKWFSTINF